MTQAQSVTEKTASHTPGPWKISGASRLEAKQRRAWAGRVWREIDIARHLSAVIVFGDSFAPDAMRLDANARLIAAAPDLLSACKTLIAEGASNDAHKAVLAAIAKAEGR